MLKQQIQDVEGIAQGQQQQLVFGGKQLDGSRTLGGHNSITKGSALGSLCVGAAGGPQSQRAGEGARALCTVPCTVHAWHMAAEFEQVEQATAGCGRAAAAGEARGGAGGGGGRG